MERTQQVHPNNLVMRPLLLPLALSESTHPMMLKKKNLWHSADTVKLPCANPGIGKTIFKKDMPRLARLPYDRANPLPRRFLGIVAYDGTEYCGFQTQPNG